MLFGVPSCLREPPCASSCADDPARNPVGATAPSGTKEPSRASLSALLCRL